MRRWIFEILNKRKMYQIVKDHVDNYEIPLMTACEFYKCSNGSFYELRCGCGDVKFTFYSCSLRLYYYPEGWHLDLPDYGRKCVSVTKQYLLDHKYAYYWDDETNDFDYIADVEELLPSQDDEPVSEPDHELPFEDNSDTASEPDQEAQGLLAVTICFHNNENRNLDKFINLCPDDVQSLKNVLEVGDCLLDLTDHDRSALERFLFLLTCATPDPVPEPEGMTLKEELETLQKEYDSLPDDEKQRLEEQRDRKEEEREAEYKSARPVDSVTVRFDADGHVTGWKEH